MRECGRLRRIPARARRSGRGPQAVPPARAHRLRVTHQSRSPAHTPRPVPPARSTLPARHSNLPRDGPGRTLHPTLPRRAGLPAHHPAARSRAPVSGRMPARPASRGTSLLCSLSQFAAASAAAAAGTASPTAGPLRGRGDDGIIGTRPGPMSAAARRPPAPAAPLPAHRAAGRPFGPHA